jgi:hypothetical protein
MPPIVQTTTGIYDVPICSWTSTSGGAIQTLVDQRRLTNDSWHDMRPLSNLFVGTNSGSNPPQYRFSDDLAFVEFSGTVATPPTTGNYNNITFFTIPSNYRPTTPNLGPQWLVSDAADGAANPKIVVKPNGTVVFSNLPNSLPQVIIGIYGRYALDDINGYIFT